MKKHLIRKIVPEKTQEWYDIRKNSIGASEIAVVLGVSPYSWGGQLFLEKIGLEEGFTGGNKHTYFGTKMESVIAEVWEYYDPSSDESYISNERSKTKFRNCKNYAGAFFNPEFPWLSASLDRVITKGSVNLITGEPLAEECPLEIKTISNFAFKNWNNRIPDQYVIQVHQQMLVTETSYCEIAMLDSEKNFHVFPVERNEEICNKILKESINFWYAVKCGKTLMKTMSETEDLAYKAELLKDIYEIMPRPKPSEEYQFSEYLDKKNNNSQTGSVLTGNEEILEAVKKLEDYKLVIAANELKSENLKNKIKEFMGENEVLVFADSPKRITWKKTIKGNRVFKS